MKYEWEETDLLCGMYICCNTWSENSEDISGLCSVTYQLGFIGGSSSCMCLISVTDGLVMTFKETEQFKGDAKGILLLHLNGEGLGYRPLNQKAIQRRIEHLHGV